MFAFVVSDARTGTYYAARDPMGIVPLYMGFGRDGSIWFASEMKVLKDECERFELFPPGHYYDSEKKACERYWEPIWRSPEYLSTRPLDLVKVREGFVKAVQKRMMSDVPWGVLLSGGLDSSLVASVASRGGRIMGKFNPR